MNELKLPDGFGTNEWIVIVLAREIQLAPRRSRKRLEVHVRYYHGERNAPGAASRQAKEK